MGSNVFGTGVTYWCISDNSEMFHVLWREVILTAVIKTG
jgi:hypothetical protein